MLSDDEGIFFGRAVRVLSIEERFWFGDLEIEIWYLVFGIW